MINSKRKGKNGELEFAKYCQKQGYKVRRTAQFCGNSGEAADCVGLPGIHIEVKRNEHLNIHDAMSQAVNDHKKNTLPIVAHRKNNTDWLITMRADDWFAIYRAILAAPGNLQILESAK